MSLSSELNFYFNVATLGLRSTGSIDLSKTDHHLPIRKYFESAHESFCTYDEPYTDQSFREVRKYRKIAEKLYKLPLQARRQLDALFNNQYRYPPELYSMFRSKYKDLTGLALFTNKVNTLEELIQVKTNNNKQLEASIKNEASKMFKQLEKLWDSLKDN